MEDRQKIQFGVSAIIVNDEGKILLAKRGQNVSINVGKWEPPGGRLEFGETLKQAVVREVQEEHGVQVEVGAEVGTAEFVSLTSHWVGPAFVCKIISGVPKICESDKCTEIGWFTLEEALQLPISEFAEQDLKNYEHWLAKQQ